MLSQLSQHFIFIGRIVDENCQKQAFVHSSAHLDQNIHEDERATVNTGGALHQLMSHTHSQCARGLGPKSGRDFDDEKTLAPHIFSNRAWHKFSDTAMVFRPRETCVNRKRGARKVKCELLKPKIYFNTAASCCAVFFATQGWEWMNHRLGRVSWHKSELGFTRITLDFTEHVFQIYYCALLLVTTHFHPTSNFDPSF